MTLLTEQLTAFQRDGFLVVPDVFDAATMQAALAECEQHYYGRSHHDVLEECDASGENAAHSSRLGEAQGRIQFPCGAPVLDSLIESESYLDAYSACLGSDDISYGNSHLFVRCGLGDAPHPSYHIDHDTNSYLPPSHENTAYEYVNSWIFLHDVEEDGAPLQVIPGSHRFISDITPRLLHEGLATPHGNFTDVSKVPEFAAPVSVTAKAGSALFYSSYLVHAAVPFKNPRKQRAVWTLSLARTANSPYTRYSTIWQYPERGYSIPFLTRTTPRVRSVFGWPRPGDAYYTPHTLELLAHWFPGMDLEPYREGLAAQSS